jgi:hypothetical protein
MGPSTAASNDGALSAFGGGVMSVGSFLFYPVSALVRNGDAATNDELDETVFD